MAVFHRRVSKSPLTPNTDRLHPAPEALRNPHVGLDELVGAEEAAATAKGNHQRGDTNFGFVRVAASAAHSFKIIVRVQRPSTQVFETVTLDLATQRQVAP